MEMQLDMFFSLHCRCDTWTTAVASTALVTVVSYLCKYPHQHCLEIKGLSNTESGRSKTFHHHFIA